MTETLTAHAPSAAPSLPADDFMPEPVPRLADWVDAGLAQAKEAQRDVLTAVETLAQMAAKAAEASSAWHLRMVEMAHANAEAARALARALMAADSVTQLLALSADGARRQVETAAAQLRELSGLARRMATETAEPISANISRAFKQAA
jgi:hypothetical protein